MVHSFSRFLSACGMSLAPAKCHYTSVNARDPPTVVIADHNGKRQRVRWNDPKVAFRYLGYWLVAHDHGTKVHKVWHEHNESVWHKFTKALSRFSRSRVRTGEVVRLVNSDILSVLPYFFHSNFMFDSKCALLLAHFEINFLIIKPYINNYLICHVWMKFSICTTLLLNV